MTLVRARPDSGGLPVRRRRGRKPWQWMGILAGLSVVALGTSSCDWVQFGFASYHGGYNPAGQNAISVANVSTLIQRFSAAAGSNVDSSPAIVNGVVYVGSDDHNLYAFDAAGAPTAPARRQPAPPCGRLPPEASSSRRLRYPMAWSMWARMTETSMRTTPRGPPTARVPRRSVRPSGPLTPAANRHRW